MAPTLPLDAAALGLAEGGALPEGLVEGLDMPVTALVGTEAGPMIDAGTRAVADRAQQGTLVALEGHGHDAPAAAVAPHLARAAGALD